LNGTHQLSAYADEVNVVGENTEALLDAGEEVGLELNLEELSMC
jgi:hypothetical protein